MLVPWRRRWKGRPVQNDLKVVTSCETLYPCLFFHWAQAQPGEQHWRWVKWVEHWTHKKKFKHTTAQSILTKSSSILAESAASNSNQKWQQDKEDWKAAINLHNTKINSSHCCTLILLLINCFVSLSDGLHRAWWLTFWDAKNKNEKYWAPARASRTNKIRRGQPPGRRSTPHSDVSPYRRYAVASPPSLNKPYWRRSTIRAHITGR